MELGDTGNIWKLDYVNHQVAEFGDTVPPLHTGEGLIYRPLSLSAI